MIKHRRYGKEQHSGMPSGASHILKIGFNAGTEKQASFGKLRGFLILRNQIDNSGKYPVDYELMRDLIANNIARHPRAAKVWAAEMERLNIPLDPKEPVSAKGLVAAIEAQMAGQMNATDGILPTQIEFLIPSAAVSVDGTWTFPGTYNERFEAHKCGGCKGLFCYGDGETASRWQPDGTRRVIECNPVGKAGIEDATKFCEHSVPKERTTSNGKKYWVTECPPVARLCVMLGVRDESGKLRSLSRLADARFEFETRSERGMERIANALREGAARLGGNIGGVSGTIFFSQQNLIAPHHIGGALTKTSQVGIVLNEFDISLREGQMREGRLIEAAAVRSMLALPGPTPAQVAAVDAELVDDEPPQPASDEPDDFPADQTNVSRVGPEDHEPTDADFSRNEPADEFPGWTEAEKTENPLTVATASDDELAAALFSYAKSMSSEWQQPIGEVVKTAFVFEHNGKKYTGQPVDWFLAKGATEADTKARRACLRQVAEAIAKTKHPAFILERKAVAGSGAR